MGRDYNHTIKTGCESWEDCSTCPFPVELHEKTYPILSEKYSILGKSVRVDGHCGCPHPKDCRYPTLEDIETELVEARKEFPKITFDSQRSFSTSDLRTLDGIKYIRLYHIDTLVGLKEFADTVRKLL